MTQYSQVHYVQLSEIQISENRQRQVFDKTALEELSKSITKSGLMHPIVLETSDNMKLIAGERRCKVIASFYDLSLPIKFLDTELPVGYVPVLFRGEIDEVTAKELEFAENFYREDLTWQERARAIAELHELRTMQNGEVSAVDIAREVYHDPEASGSQVTHVTEAISLAKHLEDPDVVKAKSQKEAVKIVRRKLDEERREKQAVEFAQKKSRHTLLHSDCLDFLDNFSGAKFDILLTDPPYGVGMDSVTSWDGSKHEYDDSAENFQDLLRNVFSKLPDVLKDDSHLYMFCDIKNWQWLANTAAEMLPDDFKIWPRPFIWYKGNIGAFPKPEEGPRYTYECILYITRGNKKTTGLYQDVICVNQSTKQIHPAGKPVELYADLLKRSANPGDTVLDLFAGGGTIFPAAKKCFVTATGIEKTEKYYNLALERLNETGE